MVVHISKIVSNSLSIVVHMLELYNDVCLLLTLAMVARLPHLISRRIHSIDFCKQSRRPNSRDTIYSKDHFFLFPRQKCSLFIRAIRSPSCVHFLPFYAFLIINKYKPTID